MFRLLLMSLVALGVVAQTTTVYNPWTRKLDFVGAGAALSYASQAECEAGLITNKVTSPECIAQAIAALAGGSLTFASQAEAEAGTDNTKVMSPLRTAEAIAALAGAGTAPDFQLDSNTIVTAIGKLTIINGTGVSITESVDGNGDPVVTFNAVTTVEAGDGLTCTPTVDGTECAVNTSVQRMSTGTATAGACTSREQWYWETDAQILSACDGTNYQQIWPVATGAYAAFAATAATNTTTSTNALATLTVPIGDVSAGDMLVCRHMWSKSNGADVTADVGLRLNLNVNTTNQWGNTDVSISDTGGQWVTTIHFPSTTTQVYNTYLARAVGSFTSIASPGVTTSIDTATTALTVEFRGYFNGTVDDDMFTYQGGNCVMTRAN